jgi:hypothetical protein
MFLDFYLHLFFLLHLRRDLRREERFGVERCGRGGLFAEVRMLASGRTSYRHCIQVEASPNVWLA